jgi:hypothetical protein
MRPPDLVRCFDAFCLQWLTVAGWSYGPDGREALARAHPALFGPAYDRSLREYECWLSRQNFRDTLQHFAQYMEPRYCRWLAAGCERRLDQSGSQPFC